MSYQSPFRFIVARDEVSDAKTLQRLKRQLLTEFDLNDQQPLVRQGVSLSKADALSLFDTLTPQTWAFHQQIWANKSLLAFLETGELPAGNGQETWPDGSENQELYAFILPNYSSRYADALVQAYDAGDPARVTQVLNLPMIDAAGSASLYYRRLWSRLIQVVREVETWINELASPALTPAGKQTLLRTIKATVGQYEKQLVVLHALPAYFKPASYQIAKALGDLFLQLNDATGLRYWLKRRIIHLMQQLGDDGKQLAREVSTEQAQRTTAGRWNSGGSNNRPSWFYYVFLIAILARGIYTFTQEAARKPTVPSYANSTRLVQPSQQTPVSWSTLPQRFSQGQLAPFDPVGSKPVPRPATGSHPLESWLLLGSGRGIDTYNEEAHIEIHNRSSQDVIGFFYTVNDWFLSSYYVRAGDTKVITFLHNGQADQYGLRWLAGTVFSRKSITEPSATPIGFARPVPVMPPGDSMYKAPYAFRPTTVDEMSRKETFGTLDTTLVKSLYMARMLKSDQEPYTIFRLTDAGKTVVADKLTAIPE